MKILEWVNRMIVWRATVMLYGAQLPPFLCAKAARTGVHVMNQTPTRSQTKSLMRYGMGRLSNG